MSKIPFIHRIAAELSKYRATCTTLFLQSGHLAHTASNMVSNPRIAPEVASRLRKGRIPFYDTKALTIFPIGTPSV